MMWNWLVTALATGASVVLYDGSPLIPSPNVLWDLTDRLGYVNKIEWKHNGLCSCCADCIQAPALKVPFSWALTSM